MNFTQKALLEHIKDKFDLSIRDSELDRQLIDFAEAWHEATKGDEDKPIMSIKNGAVTIHDCGTDESKPIKKNQPLDLGVVMEKERLLKELSESETGDVIGTSLTLKQATEFIGTVCGNYSVESDSEGVYILVI